MKNWIVLLTLASLFFIGCQKDSFVENPDPLMELQKLQQTEAMIGNIGQEITLKVNQTVMIRPDGFYITFKDVLEDSRCPSTVDCIWEGRAIIQLALEDRDEYIEAALETPNTQNENGDAVNQFGRTIQLLNVAPYPDGHLPIPLSSYRVTIMVNKEISSGGGSK